jgi:hypothetical protein
VLRDGVVEFGRFGLFAHPGEGLADAHLEAMQRRGLAGLSVVPDRRAKPPKRLVSSQTALVRWVTVLWSHRHVHRCRVRATALVETIAHGGAESLLRNRL